MTENCQQKKNIHLKVHIKYLHRIQPCQDGPHVRHDHSVQAPSSETYLSKQHSRLHPVHHKLNTVTNITTTNVEFLKLMDKYRYINILIPTKVQSKFLKFMTV